MRTTDAVGRYGERVAEQALKDAGMVILARNWRCGAGELDIVAQDGDTLVAVEVKTRRSDRFGHPVEAMTREKRRRVRLLALQWILAHPGQYESVRIDLVAVLRPVSGPARITHLRAVA